MTKKLPGLTIFFPFYNDAGTVQKAIDDAYFYGNKFTSDLEVIAIHGGNSKDSTHQEIQKAKKRHKDLVIVDKQDNWEGYAVIKYGFQKASKDWIFYTDGDLQYHLDEMEKLIKAQDKRNATVINGYKTRRSDNLMRILLGNGYKKLSCFLFRLPIRDTDCDFRLIKRELFENFSLDSHDASILPEMIKKLQLTGAKFTQVPVNHYERVYGKSNYTFWSLFTEKLKGDLKLWWQLRKITKKAWNCKPS